MLTHTSSQSAAAEGRLTSSSPPTGNSSTSFLIFFNSSPARRSRSAGRFSSRVSVLLLFRVFRLITAFFFFSLRPPSFFLFFFLTINCRRRLTRPCESNWRYQHLRPIDISFSSTSAVFIFWRFLCGLALGACSFCDSVSRLSRLRFHIPSIRQRCSP